MRALIRFAPLLLAVSVAARVGWTYTTRNGANFVDLHVYYGGGAVLGTGGLLYDYAYLGPTAVPLPFTYPPFAAVVFYPLHFLPFQVVAMLWLAAIVAGLYAVIRIAQRLMGDADRRIAMAWTAAAIWLDPVRATLDYGQVSVFLCAATMAAVLSTRWWVSGLLVGAAAGVKLTPAVSGLYFLGARRYGAAVFAGCVFVSTCVVAMLVFGDEVTHYFRELIFEPGRMGGVGRPFNQSLRGVVGVLAGRDDGLGAVLVAVLVATAILAVLAWRTAYHGRADEPDRLGGILVIQLFGLLASPISWTHHWVWVVPLMVWLVHGRLRDRRGATTLAAMWFVVTLACSPWILRLVDEYGNRGIIFRLPALLYVGCAVVTLGWVAVSPRLSRRPSRTPSRWSHRATPA